VYSELIWEHFQSPINRIRPEKFDRSVRKVNPICPDVLEFFLQQTHDGSQVEHLCFQAEACAPVVACASVLCERAHGMPVERLAQISIHDLQSWMGPLPPNKQHALALVVDALKDLLGPQPFKQDQESV